MNFEQYLNEDIIKGMGKDEYVSAMEEMDDYWKLSKGKEKIFRDLVNKDYKRNVISYSVSIEEVINHFINKYLK